MKKAYYKNCFIFVLGHESKNGSSTMIAEVMLRENDFDKAIGILCRSYPEAKRKINRGRYGYTVDCNIGPVAEWGAAMYRLRYGRIRKVWKGDWKKTTAALR